MDHFTTTERYTLIDDKTGQVVLEAGLLDLNYFMGSVTRDYRDANPNASHLEIGKELAKRLNEEFNSTLDRGQAMDLMTDVGKKLADLKKKNLSREQESQGITESTPSVSQGTYT